MNCFPLSKNCTQNEGRKSCQNTHHLVILLKKIWENTIMLSTGSVRLNCSYSVIWFLMVSQHNSKSFEFCIFFSIKREIKIKIYSWWINSHNRISKVSFIFHKQMNLFRSFFFLRDIHFFLDLEKKIFTTKWNHKNLHFLAVKWIHPYWFM